jgi:hypothetical protein
MYSLDVKVPSTHSAAFWSSQQMPTEDWSCRGCWPFDLNKMGVEAERVGP